MTLSKAEFYALLQSEKLPPRTAQPSPYEFINALQEDRDCGDGAVVITIYSTLSGTFQGAVLARELLGYETCYVVDSLTAAGGQRILVEYAVRLRDSGCDAAEIAARVENLRSRIVLYACMDTMEYLYRGGRISRAAYTIDKAGHIKHIIHVTKSGSVEAPYKALGMKRGIAYLYRILVNCPPAKTFSLYAMYSGIDENGILLRQYLDQKGICIPESRFINVGAAIGSHVGPNGCGIVYVAAQEGG